MAFKQITFSFIVVFVLIGVVRLLIFTKVKIRERSAEDENGSEQLLDDDEDYKQFVQEEKIFFLREKYCEIELTPLENLPYLDPPELSNSSWVKNYGFENVGTTNSPFTTLVNRKITQMDLEEYLKELEVKKHDYVMKFVHNEWVEESDLMLAYGDSNAAIFYKLDPADGFVQTIWLTFPQHFNSQTLPIVLHKLGQRYQLILVDSTTTEIVNLSDLNAINYYLRSNKFDNLA